MLIFFFLETSTQFFYIVPAVQDIPVTYNTEELLTCNYCTHNFAIEEWDHHLRGRSMRDARPPQPMDGNKQNFIHFQSAFLHIKFSF